MKEKEYTIEELIEITKNVRHRLPPNIADSIDKMSDRKKIVRDFADVINRYSLENGSNTPDFILAEYLFDCLQNFNKTSRWREKWYGKSLSIGEDLELSDEEHREILNNRMLSLERTIHSSIRAQELINQYSNNDNEDDGG